MTVELANDNRNMKDQLLQVSQKEEEYIQKIDEFAKKEKEIVSGEIYRGEVTSLRNSISYLKLDNQKLKMKLSNRRINEILTPLSKKKSNIDNMEYNIIEKESKKKDTNKHVEELQEALKDLTEISLPRLVDLSQMNISSFEQYHLIQQRKMKSIKKTQERTNKVKSFLGENITSIHHPSSSHFGSLPEKYFGDKMNTKNHKLIGKIEIERNGTENSETLRKVPVLLNPNQYQKIKEIFCI